MINKIDDKLVHQLVAVQFPQWKDLPIRPVTLSGWDNRTFHLGEQMLVRMPSNAEYAGQVKKEQYWLPKLAPQLPLPIPAPLVMGKPSANYPWSWSIYLWLDGDTASIERIDDLSEFAIDLAEFLCAFQHCDATDGPVAGEHSFYRGGALATYDAETRQAIAILKDKIDISMVTEIWNIALSSTWDKPDVWVHGDVEVGNLLVKNRKLSAVIDFGQLCIGDPACDLSIAWTFFKGNSREAFRAVLKLDNDTWARGRGWTLWKALIVCAAIQGTNPLDAKKSWQVLDEVLIDYQQSGF